jgi:hypothetical protein
MPLREQWEDFNRFSDIACPCLLKFHVNLVSPDKGLDWTTFPRRSELAGIVPHNSHNQQSDIFAHSKNWKNWYTFNYPSFSAGGGGGDDDEADFWLQLPRTFSSQSSRFELPLDLSSTLADMSPVQYLSRYVAISSARRQLYDKVEFELTLFTRCDRVASGTEIQISFSSYLLLFFWPFQICHACLSWHSCE